MLSGSFFFVVLCFLGILLFFTGLPNLKNCLLPEVSPPSDISHFYPKMYHVLVLSVTLIYSVSAFWNLGNLESPQTFVPMEGSSAVFEIQTSEPICQLAVFSGVGTGEYWIEYSDDAEGWFPVQSFVQDHVAVLKWTYLTLEQECNSHYIRIICSFGAPWLGEVAFFQRDGIMSPVHSSVDYLTDEGYCVPASSNYSNSSYFDEIYHARTAWEHLNNIWPYEISHPPLGKEIISLGIILFGMSPFGWRFCGTLAGILMVPLMYLFVNRLFHSRRVALLSCILLSSGFMHYVQTRIATVDSFAVLFILLMYFFFYGWFSTGNLKDLALSGLFFGIGTACKWTCLYAGAGLALLWICFWVGHLIRDGKNVLIIFFKNILFCLFFFLIIPCLIYYLSYFPYGKAESVFPFSREYTQIVLDNQRFMFQYHSSVVAEHPYSSKWYQWILNLRPILYYLEYLPDGKRISIAAFVNPLICWTGLLCIPTLVYFSIVRRDKISGFLLVGYFSGLIPWIFISRLTFEYHYFASSLFLVPMIAYIFRLMELNNRHGKQWMYCFTAAALLLFISFFPVLNGLPIDNTLGSKLLGWLPSWPI